MKFLSTFEKDLDKIDGVSTSSEPPRYWFSTGNYVLNRIISGSFHKGIPQGRTTLLAGPSASGKSFLLGNIIKQAQKEGGFVVVIDSENALDDDFVHAIGVDTDNNYFYASVITINQMQKVVSGFIKGYKTEHGTDTSAPKVVICIDSLSMLMTDTEMDHYDKGEQKGDMGQRNKQLKASLRGFAQDIKELNISIVTTSQVYRNHDLLNGEGNWIIPDALRYCASQIVLLTKLKLKQAGSSEVDGIRMKAEGFKTRFCRPFQSTVVEVPYETGMDVYNGLLDVAVGIGVVKRTGAWYSMDGDDKKWRSSDFSQYADRVLVKAEMLRTKYLQVDKKIEEETDEIDVISATSKRQVKFSETALATKVALTEGQQNANS